ncbi:MAG: RHS repeat-associated core domain-containing protein [Thermoplasmata archaeon]
MEVETVFVADPAPKITARLKWIDPSLTDWQIVWRVFPAVDAQLLIEDPRDYRIPISWMCGTVVPVSELYMKLVVPSQDTFSHVKEFIVDWRDARAGTASVRTALSLSGGLAHALEISFEKGCAEIDPSLVVPYYSIPTASYQRHTFWYGGYYWIFYPLSTGIGYSLSPDGWTWGWESTVPGGTALRKEAGFDVAARDGKVAVAWIDSYAQYLYFQKGKILGSKIAWDQRVTIATISPMYPTPVSCAIGSDGSYWVLAQTSNAGTSPYTATVTVYRSLDGTSFGQSWQYTAISGCSKAFDLLLPLGNGNMALVETSGASYPGAIRSTVIGWRYFSASSGLWSSQYLWNISIQQDEKNDKFSAVAGPDGTIYVAYLTNDGNPNAYYPLYLARLKTYGEASIDQIVASGTFNPAIALDYNGMLHVFYTAGLLTMKHVQSRYPAEPEYPIYWYPADTIPSLSGGTIQYVSCALAPVQFIAATWVESGSIVFCSLPLPYGTPGVASDPWSREGLSPYGSYFSTAGDFVSPGSGILTLKMTDVSIPSRSGLDLGISRLYMQPKYFRASDGKPYQEYYDARNMFPLCKLGQGWGLDLPWMDDTYVGLPGGQRFIIQWGNNGNESEFVNHDGVHFVLSKHDNGTDDYYQLTLASGVSYKFLYWTNEKHLVSISDGRGSDPMNGWTPTGSCINVSYRDKATRLYHLNDMALNRFIYFAYYTSGTYTGYLASITAPDGGRTTFNYTTGSDGRVLLRNVTDEKNRVTSFEYNATADYCLGSVTFPTKAKITYSYAQDPTVGTEVRSWLVTRQVLRDDKGSLIRQTDYEYKIASGRIKFAKVVERDENGQVQGWTEYIYQSDAMKHLVETKKDASGIQLSRTVTWFDLNGQPVRVDTYKGSSQEVSYSEYTGYDEWGNVIFTRNALGHESYASYANTNTQNGFFGYGKLTRTGSGKIFHETFDDWDFSDWTTVTGGGTVSMDGSTDPPNSPALRLYRTTSAGSLYASHGFTAQSGDFVAQLSMRTSVAGTSATASVFLYAGSSSRLGFRAYNGNFEYYTGSVWTSIGVAYLTNTWYDVGFVVRGSVYDIYIDGALKKQGASLYNSGSIDSIGVWLTAAAGTDLYLDTMRIYKSLTLTVTLPTGYSAELFDMKDKAVDRTRNGTLYIPALPLSGPPFYMKVWRLGADSYDTLFVDIWGGDAFSFAGGMTSSSTSKTTVGFGRAVSSIADDSWPSATTYSYAPTGALGVEGTWITDHGYSVSGSKYHESAYAHTSHYHGYSSGTAMPIDYDDILAQYIWLEDGKMPQEIMVQYYFGNQWRRAYWGGGSSDQDIIEMASEHSALKPTTVVRVGDVPAVKGKWIQLVVSTADLGLATGTSSVTGIIYGLYGGYARWDFSSRMDGSVQITGLTAGQEVQLEITSGSSWRLSRGGSGDKTYWLTAMYERNTLDRHSSPNSIRLAFANGPSGYDTGVGTVWRESTVFPISTISLWMKVTTYSHNGHSGDTMDTGVRLRLYDSSGTNYATYTYWLACWSGTTDNKTPGANTKVIWGKPPLNSWLNPVLRPSSDWSINWASCVKVKIELYFYASYALGDYLTVFYDDLTVTDISGYAEANRFDGEKVTLSRKCASGATSVVFDPYMAGVNANPASGRLRVLSGSTVLYEGPSTSEVYNMDVYAYSASEFYANKVREWRHADRVGSLTYQDAARAVPQKSYSKLSLDGDVVESKSNLEARWISYAFGYDKYGNQLWARDPTARELTYEYSATDGYTYLRADTLGGYERIEYDYYLATGKLKSVKDALNRVTAYEYDILGRLTKITYPNGAYDTYEYDDKNSRATKRVYTSAGVLVSRTVWTFDSIGRLVKAERYGTGSIVYSSESFAYNWQDQVRAHTDARGHVTTVAYDFLGRQTRVTYPDRNYTIVAYDDINNIVTWSSYNYSSGALTHRLAKVYDDLGRLNATREYTTATAHNATLMTYDAAGNLLTVRDARAQYTQVTRMAYDSFNRHTSTRYPDGLTEIATYDDAGRLLTKTDREGNVTSSEYHPSTGRLTKVVSPSDTVQYTYDAAGQLQTASNSLGSITYTYTTRGKIETLTQVIGTNSYQLTFGYDSVARLKSITYPDGVQVTYEYDAYDRVINVYRGTTELLLSYTYFPDDTVETETHGSGSWTLVTTFAYDSCDRVSSIVMKKGTSTKLSLAYTYDDVGNVKSIFDAVNNRRERYFYDWLDRLTAADGGSLPALTYTYDAVGNRLTRTEAGTTTSYAYGRYNKISSDTTWANYTHDLNGNIAWKKKSDTMWNYQFNSLDQLTKVVKWTYKNGKWSSSTIGEYWYDANGARAKSVEGAVTTEYVFLGHDPLCEKSGTTWTRYVYVDGRLEAKLVGTDKYYYIADALGSTRQVWKHGANSAAFSVATYKPFGIAVSVSGTEKVRYAGELFDPSSGLYYIFARYMDPELGRFISLDPELGSLRMPQSLNRYVYCVNNPLRFMDPTGMGWTDILPRPGENWWDCIVRQFEDAMYEWGFVPGLDTASDAYFFLKGVYQGDTEAVALYGGFLLVPYVGSSWLKIGAKYWDDLLQWFGKFGRRADDVPIPKNPTKSIQGQDFYRYMTNAEYQNMLGTKTDGKYLLKTLSSRGETFFSPNRYSSYPEIASHLGVEQPKSLRVHFRVLNEPILSKKAGIARYYDGTPIPGGGIELASKEDIWVEILDVSRLLKWPAMGV